MKAHEFRTPKYLLFALLFACGTVGCVDEEDSLASDGDIDVAPAVEEYAQMMEEGLVTISSAAVENDFVESGYPMSAISASLKIVLSNIDVADLIDLRDLPAGSFLDPSQACFDVSRAGLSVEFDFSGCTDYGLAGKITVAKKITGLLAGPLVITFKDGFAIKDVALDGSFGLTRIAGKKLTFNAFTAAVDGERGTPITVQYLSKDLTATARFDGKVKISLIPAEILLWGIASTSFEGVTSTLYVGGVSEDEVTGNVPPRDAVAFKVIPFDCYCPSRGVMSGNVTLDIGDVSFDLDDFTPDNGTDDYPEFVIPVDIQSSYTATVRFKDCGLMKVMINVEDETPIDFSVGIDVILQALETAHGKGLIPDDLFTQMKAIIAGFQGYAPSLQITVGDLLNTIGKALDQDFYVPFCAVNM